TTVNIGHCAEAACFPPSGGSPSATRSAGGRWCAPTSWPGFSRSASRRSVVICGSSSATGSSTASTEARLRPATARRSRRSTPGGVNPAAGLTDYHPDEVDTRRVVVDRAERSYVLADSSKLGVIAVRKVCDLDRLTAVLTDGQGNQDAAAALVAAGVDLRTPG